MKPGSATLLLGDERHSSEDKLTCIARRLVVLKALNETTYRFTSIPGALRPFAIHKDKPAETAGQTQCKKEHPSVQPSLKQPTQSLMKANTPEPVQDASNKKEQPKARNNTESSESQVFIDREASVRPFVSLSDLSCLNRWTFDLDILHRGRP